PEIIDDNDEFLLSQYPNSKKQ
mgnify:CR=1